MEDMRHALSDVHALLVEVVGGQTSDREYAAALCRVADAADAAERTEFSVTALPLLACYAAGGSPQAAVPVAAAWRALTIAAKMLDDVEDGDVARLDASPTAPARVVNLSTGFIAASTLALSRLPSDLRQELSVAFSRTILEMAGGQHVDITQRETLDLAAYARVMAAKSGSFFALATRAGARCATTDAQAVTQLEQFGFNVGILVQIRDDLKDLRTVDRDQAVAVDRCSLPILYALEVATPATREQLDRLLALAPTDREAETKIQQIVVDLGGELYLLAELIRYRRRALTALQSAGLDECARGPLGEWLERLESSAS